MRAPRFWVLAFLLVFVADATSAQRRVSQRQVDLVRVPDVSGRTVSEALALIDRAGLRRGNVDSRPATGPPGVVLDQSLKPGTQVRRGTPLHLTVSQAPEVRPAIVPDVTNRRVTEALAIIDRAGLARGNIDSRPATGPPGVVLDQSLKPGTQVRRGTPLNLAVSQAPVVPPVPVVPPAQVTPATPPLPPATTEPPTQIVPPAPAVPPAPVVPPTPVIEPAIVPNVTNRPVAEALALIDKAGLARGTVAPRTAAGPAGIVRDQSLAAGTEVARGTPLHLGVSQIADAAPTALPDTPVRPSAPVAPLLVPAVVGRDVTEARTLIMGAGLTIGSIIERPFFLPPLLRQAGTIYEQQPAAGTALAAPAPVNVIVLQRVPAWAMVLPLAVLGAAVGFLVRRQHPDRLRRPRPLPRVTTHVSRDPGDQRITSPVRPVTMEIRVRPVVDRGRQSVKAPPPPSDRASVDAPRLT